MNKFFILMMFLCLPITATAALELDGSLTDTGSEGTYQVNLENSDNGHVYNGTAIDMGDGHLKVDVSDGAGESFTGVAVPDENDDYSFMLHNTVSGAEATGTMDEPDAY